MALFEKKPIQTPATSQTLAPAWLIVTHLLGAAVMLYFVSYPATRLSPAPKTNNVINVAGLQPPLNLHTTGAPPHNKIKQKLKVVE